MKIFSVIKVICKYGRIIDDIYFGSIIFVIFCLLVMLLDELWRMYVIGDLCWFVKDGFLMDSIWMKY